MDFEEFEYTLPIQNEEQQLYENNIEQDEQGYFKKESYKKHYQNSAYSSTQKLNQQQTEKSEKQSFCSSNSTISQSQEKQDRQSQDRNKKSKSYYQQVYSILSNQLEEIGKNNGLQDDQLIKLINYNRQMKYENNSKYQENLVNIILQARQEEFSNLLFVLLYSDLDNEEEFVKNFRYVLSHRKRIKSGNGQEINLENEYVDFAAINVLKKINKKRNKIQKPK